MRNWTASCPSRKRKRRQLRVITLGDLIDGAKKTKANLSAYDLGLKPSVSGTPSARPADSLTQDEIIGWLDEEKEDRDWKPAHRNRYQAAWSSIYRVGIQNRRVTENPASGIAKLQEDNSRVRFLSMEEEIELGRGLRQFALVTFRSLTLRFTRGCGSANCCAESSATLIQPRGCLRCISGRTGRLRHCGTYRSRRSDSLPTTRCQPTRRRANRCAPILTGTRCPVSDIGFRRLSRV